MIENMCGRFAFWNDKNQVLEHYGLEGAPDFYNSYNITPSYRIPVVRGEGTRELGNCHWGFIPHWAKDTKLQPINARADGVATKPFFREAFRKRRCLIPASGYYEWKTGNGHKQPYFLRVRDSELFSFAGIWDTWASPDGDIESCAIITTDASPSIANVHNRMPVIISPNDYDNWLKQGGKGMLVPYKGEMEAWPVNSRVNSPRNDDPDLIRRLA